MKKFISDVLFNATYQVLLIILPIITMPILSRRLGTEGLGIYSYVFSIAQFLMILISVGMNPLRIRRIAQNKFNKDELNKEFWNLFIMQALIGLVITTIYFFAIFLFKIEYKELYYIQLIFLIGTTFDIAWFFQGIEQFAQVVIRNVIIKLLSVLLIILLVKNDKDLPLYVLITSASTVVGSLIFWLSLKNKISKPNFSMPIFKSLWKPSLIILLPQVFMQVYTTLDKTVVGSLTTNTELSYYDQSQKIARILLTLLSSLTIVMLPKMTGAIKNGDNDKVYMYTKKAFNYTLTFSLILFSIIFANTKEFVVWFFGPKFVPMTANMMIVSFIIILNPIGGIFSNQFALAMEKDKEYGIPLIIGSIVSLLGNYILVPIYNALGATIVLVFVELIVCLLRIVLIKDFINLQFLITKQILIELGLTIAITITGLLLPSIFANSFFNIAYKSMVMLLLFGIILFTTKSEVVLDVKKILKGTKN